jgi:chromosomal replication initiator protein
MGKNRQSFCIDNDPVSSFYLFENFISGDCNQVARSYVLKIAENPIGTIHNPIAIFGKTGLGKTHLLHAIVNKIRENKPEYKVVNFQSETFCSHLVNAFKIDGISKFLKYFSKQDILIMDDLCYFDGKPATQQYLIRVLDQFLLHGKQVILSTSISPNEIRDVDSGLLSRISRGMLLELTIPDSQTMIEILNQKIIQFELEIPEPILKILASTTYTNIREMEGTSITLMANYFLQKKKISNDLLD